jgi:4-amino-4-deoxy-L-arabinose transferase-like glycosyltransferase
LSEKTKIALGVILALVLALSLAGISYYFPASNHNSLSVVELVVGNVSVGNASSQAGRYVISTSTNQPLWVYLGIIGLVVFSAIVVGAIIVSKRTKTKTSLGN